MLKRVELGNFKSFGEIQSIDLKPITLLFGANSAGKSTILQSLIYLSEVFHKGSWDIYSTDQGGEYIDFGGLENIVHGKDTENIIHFGLTLSDLVIVSPDDLGLEAEFYHQKFKDERKELNHEFLTDNDIPHNLCTFTVRFGISVKNKSLAYFSIAEDSVEMYDYTNSGEVTEAAEPQGEVLSLKWTDIKGYEIEEFKPFSRFFLKGVIFDEDKMSAYSELSSESNLDDSERRVISLVESSGITADDDQLIGFWIDNDDLSRPEPFLDVLTDELNDLNAFFGFDFNVDNSEYPISQDNSLRKVLRNIDHLGYFRPVPDRMTFRKDKRLYSTLFQKQIWEKLLSDQSLREKVNSYLVSTDKLDTGYELVVRSWAPEAENRRATESLQTLEIRDLRRDTIVSLKEIGQGVIQIIPVLAVILSDKPGIVSVEQPELHLHPGLQARIGKVLADSVRDMEILDRIQQTGLTSPKQLMIETHSEHLIKALQLEIARGDGISKEDVSILYIQADHDKTQSIVRKIDLDEGGSFTEPWPDDFFDSSSDLTYDRLKLTRNN